MLILLEWFYPEMSSRSRSITAMCDGNFVVSISTINQPGEEVLKGTAEVAQLTTVYAFTGQGLQEQGMGMDSYNTTPVAHAVWNSADTHLISAYGFSIVEIVRENPKKRPSTSVVSRARQSVSAIWR